MIVSTSDSGPARPAGPPTALLLALGFAAIAGCARPPSPEGGASSERVASSAPVASVPILGELPDFALVDHRGRAFSSSQLRGSPWVATFIFTRCGSTCPAQTAQFTLLQDLFDADPLLDDVKLVSFTVDPEHDTPAVLREHAAAAGAGERWSFVTGQRTALRELTEKGFRLPILDTPENPQSIIAHAQSFVLVDDRLRIRGYHDGLDPAARAELLRSLRAVVSEARQEGARGEASQARRPPTPPNLAERLRSSAPRPLRSSAPLPPLTRSLVFRLQDEDGRAFGSNELFGKVWLGTCADRGSGSGGSSAAGAPAAWESLLIDEADSRDEAGEPLLLSFDLEDSNVSAAAGASPARDSVPERHRRHLRGAATDLRVLCDELLGPDRGEGGEGAERPGQRGLALVDRSLRVRGRYAVVGTGAGAGADEEERLARDLEWVLAERPPVTAHPEAFSPPWLSSRRDEQLAAAADRSVLDDFQFVDRRLESGITFRNVVTPDGHRDYKLCHYDHGNGLAVADVDGDGLLDIYFVNQVGSNELWRNLGDGRFADITASAGVGVADRISIAASFADVDNDGDADLFVTSVRGGNLLFANDGAGRFTDVSAAAGLDHVAHSSSAVFLDWDRDGLLDLFVANIGRYTSDELAPAPTSYEGEAEGELHEYHVGLTDAFAGHLKPERSERSFLYRNLGGLRFEEVSQELQLVDEGWSGAAVPFDANGDGWPDLYVLNMQGLDELWENVEGRSFRRAGHVRLPRTSWGAMGAAVYDFDNDGLLDLHVVDMHSDMWEFTPPERDGEKPRPESIPPDAYLLDLGAGIYGNSFHRGLGGGRFEEIADEIGAETYWPWGLSVGDLNADGWEDVFVTASMNLNFRYQVNSVLLNDRGQRFLPSEFVLGVEPRRHERTADIWYELDCSGADTERPPCRGFEGSGRWVIWSALGSRSSVLFDLDRDGDLDIVTSDFDSEPLVLISDLAQRRDIRWLELRLVGTRSNRDALGATVVVEAGGLRRTKVLDGLSGYLSQSRAPLYFGLGEAKAVDSIEILWPSGLRETIPGPLPGNRSMVITEGS